MPNQQHLEILQQGADAWNEWRKQSPNVVPDLGETDLSIDTMRLWDRKRMNRSALVTGGLFLGHVLELPNFKAYNFRGANLKGSNFTSQSFHGADLTEADLSEAEAAEAVFMGTDMRGANLTGTGFSRANFTLAKLQGACLHKADLAATLLLQTNFTNANMTGCGLAGANLHSAVLQKADLTGADLTTAILVQTDLSDAILHQCRVYGMAAWDVNLKGTRQTELIVTDKGEPEITVDNLRVAQFIYLLLSNKEIRDAVDTIGRKVVLILGRFSAGRKAVLDAIRVELSKHNYVPVMFDFEKPTERNYIETVSILAKMSRFVIADVTDAKVIMEELKTVIPENPSVPVRAIVQKGASVNVMIYDFASALNFIEPMYFYNDLEQVIAELSDNIIAPAERKVSEIQDKYKRFEAQIQAAQQ